MRREIEDVVTKLFVYNDDHDWAGLESVFAPQVKLQHLLEGNEPEETMTPQQIVAAWRPIMEQFHAVHHQIGNLLTEIDGDTATVTCHGTSTHYHSPTDRDFWEVVGTYRFTLRRIDGAWKIDGEIFRCRYHSGNM